MKNIVIAAGYATRLGELTKNFPKPLLQIGQSTILGRMLDDIDRIPEIDEHIIITNHKFASIFEEWAAGRLGNTDSGSLRFAHPSHCATLAGPSRSRGHGRPRASEETACSLEANSQNKEDDLKSLSDYLVTLCFAADHLS